MILSLWCYKFIFIIFIVIIMVHLDKEKTWVARIGVMQSSVDLLVSSLRSVLDDISDGMDACKRGCVERGCDYSKDPEYRRYKQLYGYIGGIYYCIQGSEGLLSGVVLDMLSDMDF